MVPSTQVQKDWKTDHENQNQTFQLAEWSNEIKQNCLIMKSLF